jgi:RNA polymerase sigma-70 factor (ECF subfamily)
MVDRDPADPLPTRATLLARVRNAGDSASWDEFYALYRRLVYRLARRSGLGHEEAEEVQQDVFVRVAQTIGEFEARPQPGSFRSWLMQLTRWRVLDKLREKGREPPRRESVPLPDASDRTRTIERLPDEAETEAAWQEEWRSHLLEAGLARVAQKAKPAHFQVFELCTRQRWSALRVAKELRMNPGTVYIINHRLGKLLTAEVKRLEATLG